MPLSKANCKFRSCVLNLCKQFLGSEIKTKPYSRNLSILKPCCMDVYLVRHCKKKKRQEKSIIKVMKKCIR